MARVTGQRRSMAELAASLTIEELSRVSAAGEAPVTVRGRRNGMETTDAVSETTGLDDGAAEARAMWALGDYHRFATELVWPVGPVLVEACGIGPGKRVLDVAAGSGNVALRAAAAGAAVVASDLTPENLAAGRREAGARGLELDWVEADAQALPFPDAAFDVVTSCFGAMFAPDHRRTASELLRVCRAGGTIGLASFTPEGIAGEFFGTFAPYMPPPPKGAEPPVLWGSEDHVRELLAGGVADIDMSRRHYVERAASPEEYCRFVKSTFGPVIATYASLADRPDAAAQLDQAFLEFVTRSSRGPAGGPVELPYEYLLVVAQRAG